MQLCGPRLNMSTNFQNCTNTFRSLITKTLSIKNA